MTKPISLIGFNDIEISYDEMVTLAFAANTPEGYATYLQSLLLKAKFFVDKYGDEWHRILFLKNPETGRIRLWFN